MGNKINSRRWQYAYEEDDYKSFEIAVSMWADQQLLHSYGKRELYPLKELEQWKKHDNNWKNDKFDEQSIFIN